MFGQTFAPLTKTHSALAEAFKDCRKAVWSVVIFSGAMNFLMLVGPIYMLQVYDRVLTSRSVPTLAALSVFLVGAYACQTALEVIRSRIIVRAAALLDRRLGPSVHAAVVQIATLSRDPGQAQQPMRDLDHIRTFMTGSGPAAMADLPWAPVFLLFCFLLHPMIGVTALLGALVLLALTVLTEGASRQPLRDFAKHAAERGALVESDRRNSESLIAMGMMEALAARFVVVNKRYLAASGGSSDVVGFYSSISKSTRMLLQSAILGIGAYLVINGEMSAGAMSAASILVGRALAPIDMAIANWRGFVSARQSVARLSESLLRLGERSEVTALPKPRQSLSAEALIVAVPGTPTILVRDINFQLKAGEALGVIGPSGAGKTSLVRALVGIWKPLRGAIRLDGAALDQWDPESLGQHIGFVSQQVELFDGTVAQNIARMTAAPDSAAVVEAARMAGAHDMILQLPSGYDTQIGESGASLSAGQRQRIALARALFGDPFLLVLDEPNSNLDAIGESSLQNALVSAKARGAVVIVIAHRPSVLAMCDKLLILSNGMQQAFGPREDLLKKVTGPQTALEAPRSAASLRPTQIGNAG